MTTTSAPRAPRLGPAHPPAPVPQQAPPAPAPKRQAPPVHLVTTLLGALAVLAATLAIPQVATGDSWFWPTVEVVTVIWLVGIGARLASVPAPAVIVLQVLGASVALTALFTVGGIGGVIPNGAALSEAGELLTGAWQQIRSTVSPAPPSVELSFLICLSVGATALIVDILIAICRAPALVALPLLCVYSVPASIDLTMLPWQAFAAPAMLYAILLTASGLAGRQLGAGAGVARVVTGVALAAIATVIALVVAGSLTGIGTEGRLPRTSSGPSTQIGLSPFASLKGNLQRADPVDVLRVYGLDKPHYLRTVGLEKWTAGEGWSLDDLEGGDLPDAPPSGDLTQVTVTSTAYRDNFLPIYNGTASLSGVGAGWTYDSALQSVHRTDDVTPDPYQIWANFTQPSAATLRTDGMTASAALTETGDLPAEVVDRAKEVTKAAKTAFDKAEALRTYFTDPANGFIYSLDVQAGDSGDPLVDFLRNKQGFCQQYATAMAVMLRAVGVPARVAVGFTQGRQESDGSWVISSNDAHAWVEVPFDQAGWVQFDPTPLGGGEGGQQGFTASPDTATSTAAAPTRVPTGGLGADDFTQGDGPSAALTTDGQTAEGASAQGTSVPAGVWWIVGTLALALLLAAGPNLVRSRRRRSRLAVADAGGGDAAAAAWREIEDLAVDHGIALNSAESARATANRLAKAAHLGEGGRAEMRALVTAAEQAWYGSVPAAERPVSQSAAAASPDGTGAATAVAERPPGAASGSVTGQSAAGLGAAPRTMARELGHAAPLSGLNGLVPRSVRPTWWRD